MLITENLIYYTKKYLIVYFLSKHSTASAKGPPSSAITVLIMTFKLQRLLSTLNGTFQSSESLRSRSPTPRSLLL